MPPTVIAFKNIFSRTWIWTCRSSSSSTPTIFEDSHQFVRKLKSLALMATLNCSLNTPKTVKSCTSEKPTNDSSSISKVRVIVRVRPFLADEISARNGNLASCISVLERDFESSEEVAVYLKDPDTRFEMKYYHFAWKFLSRKLLILQFLMMGSFVSYHSRSECYQLDSFFGQEEDNMDQIFCREVSPLIPGIFNGCNATVFAYGATGSGKTYTMQVCYKEICNF